MPINCAALPIQQDCTVWLILLHLQGSQRKNWLFSGFSTGANASALLVSLIETAKTNDLNPYGYLKWIFEETSLMKSNKEFEKFLPRNCDRMKINEIQFNGL